jgi:hypothetical protein
MPRTFKPCDGLPHDFDPKSCEADYRQYLEETARQQTDMSERARGRQLKHDAMEASPKKATT